MILQRISKRYVHVDIERLLRVAMTFLGMMSLVENEQVDLLHLDERMHEALSEDLGGADNDHVLIEMLCPYLLRPEVAAHGTTEALHFLVEVSFEYGELLKNQSHGVDLLVC